MGRVRERERQKLQGEEWQNIRGGGLNAEN